MQGERVITMLHGKQIEDAIATMDVERKAAVGPDFDRALELANFIGMAELVLDEERKAKTMRKIVEQANLDGR